MTCETSTEYRLDPDESYTEGIVRMVAAVHDADPLSLPPLHTAIDPDALEALLRSLDTNATAGGGTVTFTYDDHAITAESDGTLQLAPD